MDSKKTFGLIGYPLSHSFSPSYFNAKFKAEQINAQYKLFPFESIEQFPTILNEEPNLSGLNVTSPHKEKVIQFLDAVSPAVKAIGAVNTIVFKDDKLIGHNTDAPAFEDVLNKIHLNQPTALVLGTGGASKAVQYVLRKNGIPFILVGRSASQANISYKDLSAQVAAQSSLWINCTPVGTFPAVAQKLALPYASIGKKHMVIDLIYNPEETAFMKTAKHYGAKTYNGLEMLHYQAQKAWELWQA